jgi:fibronectin-binding autotransporter adhesin
MTDRNRTKFNLALATAAGSVVAMITADASAQRAKGIDIADYQGPSINWVNVKAAGRDFAFIRSSRGGTVGFYEENDSTNVRYGQNTQSSRYDDLYYQTNLANAVAAGLFVGNYHFGRAGILTYVDDYGVTITHSGADEANHFLQKAGPWMKPGYLLPTYDLEDGDVRSRQSLTDWSVDFSNTIFAAKGFLPQVYVNQNYAVNEIITTVPNNPMVTAFPNNWVARWPNQTNPEAIDVQNLDPHSPPSSGNTYGPWNPSYPTVPTVAPWKFWQYGSSNTNVAGISPVDVDVAHGGIEFVKDMLIPALWQTNADGDWSTIANWNTDADPSGLGPAARLPGVNDTIILDRGAANPTINLTTGVHTIRKLFVQEALNITGGSLSVGFVPFAARSIDISSGPNSAQFSNNVTLGGTASLSSHTTQIDAGPSLSMNGGNLTFAAVNLIPDASNPGKINIGGDITLTANSANGATINSNPGVNQIAGSIDLTGGNRNLNVPYQNNLFGPDVQSNVAINNGSLTKSGNGWLALGATNFVFGAVVVNNGTLGVNGANGALFVASSYTINAGGILQIDNSTGASDDRISGGLITMNGGQLQLLGPAASTNTESVGDLIVASGASQVIVSGGSGTKTLSFGSFTRSPGATINFVGNSTYQSRFSSGVTPGAFIDQGSFLSNSDYAVYDAGSFVRAMVNGAGDSDYATAITANRHVKVTGTTAGVLSNTIYTLNLSNGSLGMSLAQNATLTLSKGGIIKTGQTTSSITNVLSGASLATGAGTEYVINTVSSNDLLNINVPINGGSRFTKSGAGVLVLGAVNGYGGATTIAQGGLRVGIAGAIPDASNITVGSGATLDLNSVTEAVGADLTLYDGTVSSAGTPTLTLSGANSSVTYLGTNGGGTISVPRLNLGTSAGTTTINVADGAAANDLTISSIVRDGTGAHGITKTGPGKLLLSGLNTFTGPIAINGGTLVAGTMNATATAAQPLGSSTSAISLDNGTLELAGVGADTLNRPITIGAGGGTIRATITGLIIGVGSGGIAGNGSPITFDAGTNNGNIIVDSVVSGVGTTVTKTGIGIWAPTALNTYTGNTFINAGSIQYSSPGNLGSLANIIVFNGATLTPTASFSDARNATINAGGATLETKQNATFTGVFSGTGGLTKTQTGSITLTNNHTYTGPTDVSFGTLAVNGSIAAASNVTVRGGTLTGLGTINGSVALRSGAINFASGGTILGNLNVFGPTGGSWTGQGSVASPVNVYSGQLTLGAGGNLTATGGVNVNGGILAGSGTITGNVTMASTDIYTSATNFSAGANITGNLTITGTSQGSEWNGQGSVAGTTTVSAKTLYVNGTLGGAGSLTLASGTNLKGLGTINKSITLSGNNRLGGHSRLYKAPGTTTVQTGTLTINSPVVWGSPSLFITAGAVSTTGDTISGNLTIQAAPIVIYTVPNPDVITDPYHGTLSGTGTATITSTGFLSGQGLVAKPVSLQGGTINFSSAGSLGPIGAISGGMSVTSGTWAGIGSVAGLVTVAGPGAFVIGAGANLTASSDMTVSGGSFAAGDGASTITGSVTYSSNVPSTWGGNITGAAEVLNVNNAATLTLTGVNTYTGQTNINDGVLVLTANNQLATSGIVTGITVVTPGVSGHGGSLRLSNGISYGLPLTLSGGGVNGVSNSPPGTTGALDSLSGSNTWTGTINLLGAGSSGTDPTINQVSAAAGASLVLSGILQNSGAVTATLAKSGAGDVVLTGASPNTYTGLTRVYGGTLILEKDLALGAEGDPNTATKNTFQLGGSNSTIAFRAPGASPGFLYNAKEWINLDGNGNGSPGLGQLDNLGGSNTYAGHLGLNGPTISGIIQSTIGVSTGTLELSGGLFTRGAGGVRNINKSGAGTLILSGDTASVTLNTSNGQLTNSTFNVNAGTMILKGTSGNTANVPGISTWNVTSTLASSKTGALGTSTVNLLGGKLETRAIQTSAASIGVGAAGGIIDTLGNNSTFTGSLSGTGAFTKNSAGRITFTGPLNNFNGPLIVNQGSLAIANNGAATRTLRVAGLTLDPTAALDLNDNDLAVDYTGASVFSNIQQYVFTGFSAGPDTTKTGIISTHGQSQNGATILALFDNALAGFGDWPTGSGFTIDSTTVAGKYTYLGDTNLDGQVTPQDYTAIDSNLGTNGVDVGISWFYGDTNFDGNITPQDYTAVDSNLGLGAGNPLSVQGIAAVPEPGSLLGMLAASGVLFSRRRRR